MSKKKQDDAREFPETIHVSFDSNGRYDPGDLNAYRDEAAAVEEDGPTRVAKYILVREGTFRKRTVEE